MAAANNKTYCIKCNKEKTTYRCGGCLQEYCYKHLEDHRHELNKQFDDIEVDHDLFRQSLIQVIEQPNNHLLIQQIDQWEHNSIKIIQQTAEEAREIVFKNTNEHIHLLENKLQKLTEQLQLNRAEKDFNEINLVRFQEELERLKNELLKPSNILIQNIPTSFINKIDVVVSNNDLISIPNESTILKSNIQNNTKWSQNGITIAGGNGYGNLLNQLSSPFGIFIDDDQSIYVADNQNHRIVIWKHGEINGQVIAGGNGQGNEINQLNNPTDVIFDKKGNSLIICDQGNRRVVRWSRQDKTNGQIIISNIDCRGLAMDDNGYIYISDREKNEVRRWKEGDINGILVAGGNGKGTHLNQLDYPKYIFVDENHSIYISDSNNHRVMKWIEGAKEGIIVAGGQGEGNDLTQLACPEGIIVDHLGTIYVSDYNNCRIMRWCQGATQGDIIIGDGNITNQLKYPTGLSFDRQGNLYVADWNNQRIQRFDID